MINFPGFIILLFALWYCKPHRKAIVIGSKQVVSGNFCFVPWDWHNLYYWEIAQVLPPPFLCTSSVLQDWSDTVCTTNLLSIVMLIKLKYVYGMLPSVIMSKKYYKSGGVICTFQSHDPGLIMFYLVGYFNLIILYLTFIFLSVFHIFNYFVFIFTLLIFYLIFVFYLLCYYFLKWRKLIPINNNNSIYYKTFNPLI